MAGILDIETLDHQTIWTPIVIDTINDPNRILAVIRIPLRRHKDLLFRARNLKINLGSTLPANKS